MYVYRRSKYIALAAIGALMLVSSARADSMATVSDGEYLSGTIATQQQGLGGSAAGRARASPTAPPPL